MPSNEIKINNSDDLLWTVSDSKMEELTEWLNKNGFKEKKND